MLAAVSHDRNVVIWPAGQGRLLVGGDQPTVTTSGAALELLSGARQDLLLTAGEGRAVVVVDSAGEVSVLASGAGNNLTLATRSDNRDVVLNPHGDGVVQLLAQRSVLESLGGADLTIRSGRGRTCGWSRIGTGTW